MENINNDLLKDKQQQKRMLLGIEVTYEEFDKLFCEQAEGKELKVVDGKVIAVDHAITEEEIKWIKINDINKRLTELSQDLIQAQAGAVFDDIETRKLEFQTLHNELRTLQGKQPRNYITEVSNAN